jgi:hypothetical protein
VLCDEFARTGEIMVLERAPSAVEQVYLPKVPHVLGRDRVRAALLVEPSHLRRSADLPLGTRRRPRVEERRAGASSFADALASGLEEPEQGGRRKDRRACQR